MPSKGRNGTQFKQCHLTFFEPRLKVKNCEIWTIQQTAPDPAVLYLTVSIGPEGHSRKSMGLREAVRGLITFPPLESRSNQ